MREAMKNAKDAGGTLEALYEYLKETELFERLNDAQDQLLIHDMPAESMQISQVWDALIQLLNQAHSLLNGARVSPKQLASWLEAGLQASELSALPPTADTVVCGALGNLPLSRPKALSVLLP